MTLQDAIAQAQQYMSTLPGIRAAPANPPDKLGPLPMAIAYAGPGEWLPGNPAGLMTGLRTIVIEVHVAYTDLAKAVAMLAPYIDSVPNLLIARLWADRWAGTIKTFEKISDSGVIQSKWADLPTLCVRFQIVNVKLQPAVV